MRSENLIEYSIKMRVEYQIPRKKKFEYYAIISVFFKNTTGVRKKKSFALPYRKPLLSNTWKLGKRKTFIFGGIDSKGSL
jgi:hypothetical protein